MLFEKIRSKIQISSNLIGAIVITIITTAFFTYGVCAVLGIVKGYNPDPKITLLDLINGFAQIATASAFFLALVQFGSNRVQQRQMTIAAEAKSQIEKIISVIKNIEIGNQTNLKNINDSIALLSNLGTNFNELFKAMREDIQKAIIRMQWQDMYFNYLIPVLNELDPAILLRKSNLINSETLKNAQKEAKEDESKTLEPFKKYAFAKSLINNPDIKASYNLAEQIDSFCLFESYYLNEKKLEDLLYGLISKVDIRTHAPLFAAIKSLQ